MKVRQTILGVEELSYSCLLSSLLPTKSQRLALSLEENTQFCRPVLRTTCQFFRYGSVSLKLTSYGRVRVFSLLQEKRSQVLWKALERAIPDIRERTELCLVGSPLTHERYLNRHRGSYGPAISAADARFPGPQTDIPGLFRSAIHPSVGGECLDAETVFNARRRPW